MQLIPDGVKAFLFLTTSPQGVEVVKKNTSTPPPRGLLLLKKQKNSFIRDNTKFLSLQFNGWIIKEKFSIRLFWRGYPPISRGGSVKYQIINISKVYQYDKNKTKSKNN